MATNMKKGVDMYPTREEAIMPSIALCRPSKGKIGDRIEWKVNKLLTRADGQVIDTR
jgi:hypothetical protein